MKSRKWILILTHVLIILAAFMFSAHAVQAKPIKLVYITFFSSSHGQSQLCREWAKEIEKRTHGAVEFTFIHGESYLHGDEIYEGIVLGAADIGMSAFAYNYGQFPVMEAVDFSIGYPSAKVATAVVNDFYGKFQPKELADVKILYLHAHGPGLLHSKKSVRKLKDLKGMRILSTDFSAQMSKALGAAPVVYPQGYVKVLLEDNYADATWSPMEVLKGWDQAHAIKYTIEPHCTGYTIGFYAAMNLKKWNILPKDVQRVIEEVSAEWIGKHAEAWDFSDEQGRKFTLSLGNKIIPLSREESDRWCKAVQPVIDEYVRRVENKGLPGKEYVETIKEFIEKYKE